MARTKECPIVGTKVEIEMNSLLESQSVRLTRLSRVAEGSRSAAIDTATDLPLSAILLRSSEICRLC